MSMETRSRTVACLLVADYDLLAVAGFAQALAACGRQWNWRPFRLQLARLQGGPLRSSCGLSLEPTVAASEVASPEILMVGGGYGVRQLANEPQQLELLRRHAVRARCVVGIGGGLLLLALAGCLGARRISAPPNLQRELSEIEPTLSIENARVLADDEWISCASSAWSLEAGLEVIRVLLGEGLANQTASALGMSGPVLPFPSRGVTIR